MSQTESQADELDQALGAVIAIEVDIESLDGSRQGITVTPFRGKQLGGVLRCINDLTAAGVDLTNLKDIENFSALLTQAPDIGFKLLAECITGEPDPIKRPHAVAESLNLVGYQQVEELMNLGVAIWTVNKNYFQKKGPAMLAALGLPPSMLEDVKSLFDGQKLLASSPPTDTASKISANTP